MEASKVSVADEPGFTEAGEIPQVGRGAVPATLQLKAIAAEKLP